MQPGQKGKPLVFCTDLVEKRGWTQTYLKAAEILIAACVGSQNCKSKTA